MSEAHKKLDLFLASYGGAVFGKVIHQDSDIQRGCMNYTASGILATCPQNNYIRTIQTCSCPQLTLDSRTLYVRGEDVIQDNVVFGVWVSDPHEALRICSDIVKLWAMVNGVPTGKIRLVKFSHGKNKYSQIISGVSQEYPEGLVTYSYEGAYEP